LLTRTAPIRATTVRELILRHSKFVVLLAITASVAAQQPDFSAVTQSFITVSAPVVALQNVRVIDGTGAPALENQAIVIADGKIRSIGPQSSVQVPAGATCFIPHRTAKAEAWLELRPVTTR
jgi:hypothetical protein